MKIQSKSSINGATDSFWKSNLFSTKKQDEFSITELICSSPKEDKRVLGPGGGAGIGCGAGLGFGLVGGIGYGAWPFNQMKLVFGLGVGCGVGFGFGFGQGIGYGFSYDSLESYVLSKESSYSNKAIQMSKRD